MFEVTFNSLYQAQHSGSRSRCTFEFEASLIYIVSPRPAKAVLRNPVSKSKTSKNRNQSLWLQAGRNSYTSWDKNGPFRESWVLGLWKNHLVFLLPQFP